MKPARRRGRRQSDSVVADQSAREADQDRREGRPPRPLRHLQMAEVALSRQMFADILTLIARLGGGSPTCARMSAGVIVRQAAIGEICSGVPIQRYAALGCPDQGLRARFAAASAKFPLLNPIKGTILAAKPLESGKCRFHSAPYLVMLPAVRAEPAPT
jgi:hypothetical protein